MLKTKIKRKSRGKKIKNKQLKQPSCERTVYN